MGGKVSTHANCQNKAKQGATAQLSNLQGMQKLLKKIPSCLMLAFSQIHQPSNGFNSWFLTYKGGRVKKCTYLSSGIELNWIELNWTWVEETLPPARKEEGAVQGSTFERAYKIGEEGIFFFFLFLFSFFFCFFLKKLMFKRNIQEWERQKEGRRVNPVGAAQFPSTTIPAGGSQKKKGCRNNKWKPQVNLNFNN